MDSFFPILLDIIITYVIPITIVVLVVSYFKKNSNYKLEIETKFSTIYIPKEYSKLYKKVIFGDEYLYLEKRKSKLNNLIILKVKYTNIYSIIIDTESEPTSYLKINCIENSISLGIYPPSQIGILEMSTITMPFEFQNKEELEPFLKNIENKYKESKRKILTEKINLDKEIEKTDFAIKFKNDFNISVNDFNLESKKNIIHGKDSLYNSNKPNDMILTYYNSSKLVFLKALKNNDSENGDYEKIKKGIILDYLSPEEKLILYTKRQLDDKFYELVKVADFEKFKSMLIPLENIRSLKFCENVHTFTGPPLTQHSKGSIALQTFISPVLGLSSLIENNTYETRNIDFSAYEFVFYNNNSYYKFYLDHLLFQYKNQFLNDVETILRDREYQATQNQINQTSQPQKTKEEKLKELQELLDKGLITQEEYNEAKTKIIAD